MELPADFGYLNGSIRTMKSEVTFVSLHSMEWSLPFPISTLSVPYHNRCVVDCALFQDSMNIKVRDVTQWDKNGETRKIHKVYIRGSKIRFIIVPDMLK